MVFIKLLFYLVVLVLILVLAYWTTRLLGTGLGRRQQPGDMKILERLAVGRDSYLLIVEIQERLLVVGVSPAGIVKLEELETYVRQNPAAAPPDFSAALAQQLKAHLHRDGKQKKNGRDI